MDSNEMMDQSSLLVDPISSTQQVIKHSQWFGNSDRTAESQKILPIKITQISEFSLLYSELVSSAWKNLSVFLKTGSLRSRNRKRQKSDSQFKLKVPVASLEANDRDKGTETQVN